MKILIAGLGLIGGSFALALRDRGIADEILGVEKSDENAAEALRLGLADRIVTLIDGRIVSNVENQVKAEIDAAPYIE
mgnify:CR=1 FL=1